jgi:hypothetical protein
MDYRFKGRDRLKTITLDPAEFIRCFLLLSTIVSNRDRVRLDLPERQGAPLGEKFDKNQ